MDAGASATGPRRHRTYLSMTVLWRLQPPSSVDPADEGNPALRPRVRASTSNHQRAPYGVPL
jgi:hypothetical protein